LNFWIKQLGGVKGTKKKPLCGIPGVPNLVLTASRGGKYDRLIKQHNLREAVIVFSEEEAKQKKLTIDHDDSHAMQSGKSFALLLHGAQPAGSVASKALSALRKKGIKGYSRSKKKAA